MFIMITEKTFGKACKNYVQLSVGFGHGLKLG
jgi:hypothetical protein